MNFFIILFHILKRFLTSKYLKLYSTNLVGEMERCDKSGFQVLKMRKKKIT